VGDLTEEQLDRMASWDDPLVDDDELKCLIAEVRRHRATVKRLEAWVVVLETDTLGAGGSGVGPFIAAELRNRMKEPGR
jgi:hypothetical protein